MLLLLLITVVGARVCYPPTTTRTPYDILDTATVETKRGCEMLCTANATCVGISFKDVGLNSSCTLLSTRVANEICIAPTEIYLKQDTNCSDRTDITAEYGVDPCIDEAVPSAFRSIGSQMICTFNKGDLLFILLENFQTFPTRTNLEIYKKIIHADGRRITLDNEKWNTLEKTDDMWAYRFGTESFPIVAAMCVRAGSTKCPCAPLINLPNIGYPALPDRVNPCAANTWLYWNVAKSPTYGAIVACKAGLWLLWMRNGDRNWGVTGLSCYPV
ncbi:hypothetical protein PRIPAC_86854 [Pristionchus pacificus]|uniref:Uncharacterized protein n=1 Tax=Pristionchus pacificus TaxID=54126 RepID=A0A2A6BVH0_PRIPA|nr:hypothetical protein PRIPAC_86854 [Pristionchus pacificus]|eukprot:PDM69816.1 hypothetical protein PRIPAC_44912 [Pristionchus pacificus]